jgi:hypothetical protein
VNQKSNDVAKTAIHVAKKNVEMLYIRNFNNQKLM